MYGVLNKDAIKSEILLPLVSGKMRLCFKKGFSEVIKCFLGKLIAGLSMACVSCLILLH